MGSSYCALGAVVWRSEASDCRADGFHHNYVLNISTATIKKEMGNCDALFLSCFAHLFLLFDHSFMVWHSIFRSVQECLPWDCLLIRGRKVSCLLDIMPGILYFPAADCFVFLPGVSMQMVTMLVTVLCLMHLQIITCCCCLECNQRIRETKDEQCPTERERFGLGFWGLSLTPANGLILCSLLIWVLIFSFSLCPSLLHHLPSELSLL